MKIKTSELIGPALDWAVAKCDGLDWFLDKAYFDKVYRYAVFVDNRKLFNPSTDWAQGGPIIEREKLTLAPVYERDNADEDWRFVEWRARTNTSVGSYGPTPLNAAMRCYAASKLGYKVDVPEELL